MHIEMRHTDIERWLGRWVNARKEKECEIQNGEKSIESFLAREVNKS